MKRTMLLKCLCYIKIGSVKGITGLLFWGNRLTQLLHWIYYFNETFFHRWPRCHYKVYYKQSISFLQSWEDKEKLKNTNAWTFSPLKVTYFFSFKDTEKMPSVKQLSGFTVPRLTSWYIKISSREKIFPIPLLSAHFRLTLIFLPDLHKNKPIGLFMPPHSCTHTDNEKRPRTTI